MPVQDPGAPYDIVNLSVDEQATIKAVGDLLTLNQAQLSDRASFNRYIEDNDFQVYFHEIIQDMLPEARADMYAMIASVAYTQGADSLQDHELYLLGYAPHDDQATEAAIDGNTVTNTRWYLDNVRGEGIRQGYEQTQFFRDMLTEGDENDPVYKLMWEGDRQQNYAGIPEKYKRVGTHKTARDTNWDFVNTAVGVIGTVGALVTGAFGYQGSAPLATGRTPTASQTAMGAKLGMQSLRQNILDSPAARAMASGRGRITGSPAWATATMQSPLTSRAYRAINTSTHDYRAGSQLSFPAQMYQWMGMKTGHPVSKLTDKLSSLHPAIRRSVEGRRGLAESARIMGRNIPGARASKKGMYMMLFVEGQDVATNWFLPDAIAEIQGDAIQQYETEREAYEAEAAQRRRQQVRLTDPTFGPTYDPRYVASTDVETRELTADEMASEEREDKLYRAGRSARPGRAQRAYESNVAGRAAMFEQRSYGMSSEAFQEQEAFVASIEEGGTFAPRYVVTAEASELAAMETDAEEAVNGSDDIQVRATQLGMTSLVLEKQLKTQQMLKEAQARAAATETPVAGETSGASWAQPEAFTSVIDVAAVGGGGEMTLYGTQVQEGDPAAVLDGVVSPDAFEFSDKPTQAQATREYILEVAGGIYTQDLETPEVEAKLNEGWVQYEDRSGVESQQILLPPQYADPRGAGLQGYEMQLNEYVEKQMADVEVEEEPLDPLIGVPEGYKAWDWFVPDEGLEIADAALIERTFGATVGTWRQARYRDSSVFGEIATMRADEILRFQDMSRRAGFYGSNMETARAWAGGIMSDEDQQNLAQVMHVANLKGGNFWDVLGVAASDGDQWRAQHPAEPKPAKVPRAPFVVPAHLRSVPGPKSIANETKERFRITMGRDPLQGELDSIATELSGYYQASNRKEIDLYRATYDQAEAGKRTLSASEMAAIEDPARATTEDIEVKYANEIDLNERKEDNSTTYQRMLAATMGGRQSLGVATAAGNVQQIRREL